MRHCFKTLWLTLVCCLAVGAPALAHDGPDPIMRWRADAASIEKVGANTKLKARLGPAGTIVGKTRFLSDDEGGSLYLQGGRSGVVVADDIASLKLALPKNAMTVSAWVSVDRPLQWGGLVGAFQDNGSDEAGWVLGCLLYTSPSPRDATLSRMPSSA